MSYPWKFLVILFFAILLFTEFMTVCSVNLATAQKNVELNGILSQDTTLTKADSPYNLTGPLAVSEGITLTIDPGVTVNLNGYYILVNGTLNSQGTDSDKICFYDGRIVFTPQDNRWDEVAGRGCILENAVLTGPLSSSDENSYQRNSISIVGPVKITQSSLAGIDVHGDSIIYSNNITGSFYVLGGSPSISGNNIHDRLIIRGGSPIIFANRIFDGINADLNYGEPTILHNQIRSANSYPIILVEGITNVNIVNNTICGNRGQIGIYVVRLDTSASIVQNKISNCSEGIKVYQSYANIKQNAVFDNNLGINIVETVSVNIQENSIACNSVGIHGFAYAITANATNNNIYNNTDYNFKMSSSHDISIPNNWWGTTNTQAINQSIYDNKNNFNTGTVDFLPFLTEPNPQAAPIPNATISPSTTNSISPSPSIPEFTPFTAATMLLVVTCSLLIISKFRKRTKEDAF